MNVSEVSALIGVPAGTLRYWRHAGKGPASFSLGPRGRIRYRRSEVERWLADQERATARGGAA
ncbi:helix-turn-helix domain-containing protein [Mycobacterium sp. CBMA293]|uniref:helix-turn-helix transcriptional regulator n=1 Tax=unclassified Mycolicibacterium TaxID=2636767 RepID=UPI0012DF3F9B|nr:MULTISPECIES: helix-turn-helix domain-containing protein [unclassified Mycolicibacterium]MUL49267.1 helix-turn-helix domain-containing protein [Mycolicibacterium sp. CBMA 360]MUL58925.1 helix-turn-helix domain-containing protein [Mycolicibacterium sp. CBMA 335]MUL69319.1 helix-turn-helix domain-containing protein [Mycolicibacterium sp. CBMA 311]MUL94283.1 helix-turn-helix domain-containing protein [Mycolicibacterium sp. CBMA 230]MUM04055.1 DNA-binding protein [Mycolicibacterium sp. CBMA 213